jgi:hypothetical protein
LDFWLAAHVVVAGLPAPGVHASTSRLVTEASVEARRGVSEMVGERLQAAHSWARVEALVVD